MFTIFGKKKIKEISAANIFINNILDTIENGFPDIVGIINDAPEFTTNPNLNDANSEKFLLIILAANLEYIPQHFDTPQDDRLLNDIYTNLAKVFDVEEDQLIKVIKSYQGYISKVNHPSKNTLYGISKAIFGKYELNQFQDDYFRNMNSPNPMFLKRLDEAVENFVWNWETFKDKYQIV